MITRKTRRGIVLLVILTAVSFWAGRKQDIDEQHPVSGLDPKLNYVLRDFELQFFDENGKATVNLSAPLLRNDPAMELGTIEKPVFKLVQPGTVWNLTSDSATVTADKEHVHLSGKVNILRHEPLTGNLAELNTEEVQIEVSPQTASTDKPVSIFDGHNQLDAIGLDLDMKTNTFMLKQQVEATYAVN
ncbi:MAG: LPS export ABC transporter periplasmic protein LptC [Xanthomonadales bacterium]|nr:LPS export ABC transporter periplasmic protein LptC [Xanthomonadales bacterium]